MDGLALPSGRRGGEALVRRIAVFSGNRAEYGLLFPIIHAMRQHGELDVQVVVSGAHLSEPFGRTVDEIVDDGVEIAARVELGVTGRSVKEQTFALARAIERFSEILDALKPDISLVYADRMEGFGAAIASFEMNIPTAHVEGGDRTEGGTHDDSVRHAMTKLAHLHFTTSPEAAERVRRLGEEEWRIVFAGLPTLDTITRKQFSPPAEVCREFSLDPSRPILVFTQHPVTTEPDKAGAHAVESLEALKAVGAQTVITYPNSDPGSQAIVKVLEEYRTVPHFQIHKSLGRRRYLGLLNVAWTVVGNSSSGIKETPSFGIPCVNIGTRQAGRLRAENVLDVPQDRAGIEAAVRQALFDSAVRERARTCSHPYGEGRCGEIVAATLASVELGSRLLRKRMTY